MYFFSACRHCTQQFLPMQVKMFLVKKRQREVYVSLKYLRMFSGCNQKLKDKKTVNVNEHHIEVLKN